jgi:hypothetical protein
VRLAADLRDLSEDCQLHGSTRPAPPHSPAHSDHHQQDTHITTPAVNPSLSASTQIMLLKQQAAAAQHDAAAARQELQVLSAQCSEPSASHCRLDLARVARKADAAMEELAAAVDRGGRGAGLAQKALETMEELQAQVGGLLPVT